MTRAVPKQNMYIDLFHFINNLISRDKWYDNYFPALKKNLLCLQSCIKAFFYETFLYLYET